MEGRRCSYAEPPDKIFFRAESAIIDAMFRDLPIRARELKATPEILERIYDAARLGLRGESLALAAGMLPAELARLKIMDPIAEIAEMKGRADSEMEMSRVVFDAAQAGDSKAALEFLKHRHDWVATQKVEVQGSAQISITVALEEAQKRVERIAAEDVVDIAPRVLPLAREPLGEAI
jgi:predicted transcriptional regulator